LLLIGMTISIVYASYSECRNASLVVLGDGIYWTIVESRRCREKAREKERNGNNDPGITESTYNRSSS